MISVTRSLASRIQKEFPALSECISIEDSEYIVTKHTGGAEKFCTQIENIVYSEYSGVIKGLECIIYSDDLVVMRPVRELKQKTPIKSIT